MRHWSARYLAVLALILLAARAAQQTTNPIVRKFSWFAYPGAKADPLEFPPHDPDQVPNNVVQVKVGGNGLSNSLFRN